MLDIQPRRRDLTPLLLALLLVVGAALRLYGVNWDDNHHLHPDERQITMVVSNLGMPPLRQWPAFFTPPPFSTPSEENPNFFDATTSTLNPHFFAYGSLPFYLLRIATHLLTVPAGLSSHLTAVPPLADSLQGLGRMSDYDHITLVGRVLSSLIDTGVIYLTFLLGKRVYDRRVGLLAAAFVTFTVFHIQVAHFYAVDALLTFFVLLFFVFALDLVRQGGFKNALLMGVVFGLALATKVSAAPLLLVIGGAYWLRLRRKGNGGLGGLGPLLLLTLAVCALVFFIAEPYAILDFNSFTAGISEQSRMVRGMADYPYTRQYINTPAFLYQIKHTILWGMGLPLGLVAYCGLGFFLWRVVRQRRGEELLLLAWIGPYFLITGSFMVKFMRYMLPLLPLFLILGAAMLYAFKDWLSTKLSARRQVASATWYGATGLVIAASVLYTCAFLSIYGRPHSRIQASDWIYRSLPVGSTLALEHWDDDLPLSQMVDGQYRNIGEYVTLKMNLYEPDGGEKFQHIVSNLQQSDYIILSSNRLYGSIPRLPWRYPITTRYYELLFEERLGFELLGTFTSYPSLLGFTINDDHADESFTVYDHPKVLIFGKTRQLDQEEFRKLFRDSLAIEPRLTQSEPVSSTSSRSGKSLLLDGPVDELPVIDEWGWNPLANAHPLLSVISWWLAIQVLGLLALPLTTVVFHRLADRAYVLSKTMGLLVVAFLVWVAASYRLLTNSLPTVLGACLVLGLISLFLFRRRRGEMLQLWRERRQLILISEGLFTAAYVFFVVIRLLNPDLWHPWNGGEKSMEFAFLNAITKSAYFPPYDPYYAGGYINYYYYGLHLVSILIKLTGIVPAVAFNLAVPSLFALTAANAFSVGYNLTRRRLSGLLSMTLLVLIANLDGLVQIVEGLGQASGWSFQSRIPGVEGLVKAVPGLVRVALGLAHLSPFDYWRSSRVIPQTINEFPYWSYLFADLHPHMIGIPVTIFVVALAFNFALAARSATPKDQEEVQPSPQSRREALRRTWRSLVSAAKECRLWSAEHVAGALVLMVTLGAVAVINTWDMPAYLILVLAALLLALGGFWRWRRALVAVILFVLVAGLSLLLYLPFFTHYQALYVGLGVVRAPTNMGQFLTIWGFFLFLVVSLLWAKVVWDRPRDVPLRGLGLLLRRGMRLPRLLDRCQTLVERRGPGYAVELLLLGGLVVLCAALLVYKMWVLALLCPLVVLFGVLVLRRKAMVEHNFVALLVFLGLGILLGCEVVFLKDFLQGGEYYRMNTIFKFYTQAWVLIALATGASLPALWSRFSRVRLAPVRNAWQVGCVLLFMSSTIFFFLGTWQRINDRFPGPRPALGTLDGSAFMTVGSHTWPDENNRIQLVYDYQAIQWFLQNVKGTPVVAEAPLAYYREFGLKVSSYTGLPTLVGAHQSEQRYDWQVGPRSDDANALYQSTDLEEARQLISSLNISYIYVGQLEHTYYASEGLEKFEELRTMGELALAYENPGVKVYEVVER